MSFKERETQKIANRIKKKVMIFPSWDGYGGTNKEEKAEEFKAHKEKYTYPMDKIQKDLIYELRQSGENSLFTAADTQLKNLEQEITANASKLVDQAFFKGIEETDKVDERYIERIANDFMNRQPEKCVITVPDKWFPS